MELHQRSGIGNDAIIQYMLSWFRLPTSFDATLWLSQILQGSNVPTFVLNQDRVITHWNLALERLTGYPGSRMVGTRRQWVPFWEKERPSMADLILDRCSEQEIWDLYGGNWKRSKLIEGAYEAEVFFSKLGSDGKWLFFTAAPIRSADGSVVGAICPPVMP